MQTPFPLADDYAPMTYRERENLAQVLMEWRGRMHSAGWTQHRHVGTHRHNLVCFGDITTPEAAE